MFVSPWRWPDTQKMAALVMNMCQAMGDQNHWRSSCSMCCFCIHFLAHVRKDRGSLLGAERAGVCLRRWAWLGRIHLPFMTSISFPRFPHEFVCFLPKSSVSGSYAIPSTQPAGSLPCLDRSHGADLLWGGMSLALCMGQFLRHDLGLP